MRYPHWRPGVGQHVRAGKDRILRTREGGASPSWLPPQGTAGRTHGGKRSPETCRSLGCLRGNTGVALHARCDPDPQLVSGASESSWKTLRLHPTMHPSRGAGEEPRPPDGPPTGSGSLRPPRALLQPPGGHRRLAAPRQLLRIAVATAAALGIAHGTTGRHHLEGPQRMVGKASMSVVTAPFPGPT